MLVNIDVKTTCMIVARKGWAARQDRMRAESFQWGLLGWIFA